MYALYSDKSMFIWDIRQPNIKVYRSFMYPSGGITDMCSVGKNMYATSSYDKTIRIWINPQNTDLEIPRNLYYKELSQILYTSTSYEHMKYRESETPTATDTVVRCLASFGKFLA
jgi:WD40 repeat protein